MDAEGSPLAPAPRGTSLEDYHRSDDEEADAFDHHVPRKKVRGHWFRPSYVFISAFVLLCMFLIVYGLLAANGKVPTPGLTPGLNTTAVQAYGGVHISTAAGAAGSMIEAYVITEAGLILALFGTVALVNPGWHISLGAFVFFGILHFVFGIYLVQGWYIMDKTTPVHQWYFGAWCIEVGAGAIPLMHLLIGFATAIQRFLPVWLDYLGAINLIALGVANIVLCILVIVGKLQCSCSTSLSILYGQLGCDKVKGVAWLMLLASIVAVVYGGCWVKRTSDRHDDEDDDDVLLDGNTSEEETMVSEE